MDLYELPPTFLPPELSTHFSRTCIHLTRSIQFFQFMGGLCTEVLVLERIPGSCFRRIGGMLESTTGTTKSTWQDVEFRTITIVRDLVELGRTNALCLIYATLSCGNRVSQRRTGLEIFLDLS